MVRFPTPLTRRYVGVAVIALALMVAAGAAWAAPAPPKPAALSDRDKADLVRVEEYLNGITTLQSRFLQVSPNGGYAEGDLYLSRPGKLKLEYAPPVPILIVVDGDFVTYYDKQLKQVQYIATEQTPANILVRDKISLASGDLTVTEFERGSGTLRLTVIKTGDPGMGSMSLVFSDRPIALRKWTVTDAQGQVTNVSLLGPRFGLTLDPKLFQFQLPRDAILDGN
jgi:outer membrane lipoprotein-sorting protein